MASPIDLPIDQHRQEILSAFATPGLTILISPPGTGKSTRVPNMLAESGENKKIICIEPRRIAARSLAQRVARERGESPGGVVGYRVRFDRKISAETRIEFVSRGVFLRQLLSNPESLSDYHAILLDEFHERQIETDWIFGLLLAQRNKFSQLRVGILSATLDPKPIEKQWPDARIIEVQSPLYPVEIRHRQKPGQFDPGAVVERTVATVLEMVGTGVPPDYLVFLPGYREIHRTIAHLREQRALRAWDILPLSGEQRPEDQDRAIRAGPRPRVVIATNLAESSLTVEGVRAVVDGGLARRMDHDPSRGINTLRTIRVSRFSARQRTGRAGRIGAGVCYRLWTQREEESLSEQDLPECQRLDLSEWLLRTLGRNEEPPSSFPWIDPPPEEHLRQAQLLLEQLGVIKDSMLTERGNRLLQIPLPPRLAVLISKGIELGIGEAAIRLAVLIEEDPLIRPDSPAENRLVSREDPADYETDLRLLDEIERGVSFDRNDGVRLGTVKQLQLQVRRLVRALDVTGSAFDEVSEPLRKCCLAAFPDRVARRIDRGTATYQCRDGSSARLDRKSRITASEWILALEKKELTVKGTRTTVLCSLVNLSPEWIHEALNDSLHRETGVFEDPSGRLLKQEIVRLDSIEVERQTTGEADSEARATYFANEALAGRIPLRKWTDVVDRWIARVNCLREFFPEYDVPHFDSEAKRMVLEMVAHDTRTAKEFRNAEILPTLQDWISPELRSLMETVIPENFPVPGRRKPLFIDYSEPANPSISLRIQEAFSFIEHPRIANGRCPLTVQLLAPNQRPVQITRDLTAFWETSYPAIRKDLFGRYPKHDWPEKIERPKGAG